MIELSRRNLLRVALATPLAASIVALAEEATYAQDKPDVGTGPFTLPPLPYKSNALEPYIDRRTMEIHHDKHHATYVKNLNDAVTKTPELQGKTPEDFLKNLDAVPEAVRATVRNNAGGHVNHTLFWALMTPRGGGQPTGAVADVIKGTFGTLDNFQTKFNEAGTKRFGSGWVWLVRTSDGKMEIVSTPNQDNPLIEGHYPILGNDVWEHAYYLKYQNRRPDYLKAWWNTVNWGTVNQRVAVAMKM